MSACQTAEIEEQAGKGQRKYYDNDVIGVLFCVGPTTPDLTQSTKQCNNVITTGGCIVEIIKNGKKKVFQVRLNCT